MTWSGKKKKNELKGYQIAHRINQKEKRDQQIVKELIICLFREHIRSHTSWHSHWYGTFIPTTDGFIALPYHMNNLQAFMPFCITHSRFNVPRESIQVAKPSWNPQVPVAKGQGVRFCVCVCMGVYLLWTPSTWPRGPEHTVPKDHREPEFLKSHEPWVLIVSFMLFLVEMNSNIKVFKIFGMGNWYAFFFFFSYLVRC